MAYFQWADDMVIDNGPIDQDHRKLVEQVNALHTATTEGRGQEVVGALLEALIHDTVQHIQREEQQMAALGYPHLEQHRAEQPKRPHRRPKHQPCRRTTPRQHRRQH